MSVLQPLSTKDLWAEPKPLPDDLPPVHAFEPRLLPPQLRAWVMDITERLQVPADFIAAPVMVAAGAVIGRKVGLRPQEFTDWTVVPNLWGCVVGRPGVMKSPAVSQALAPIKRLNILAAEENDAAAREHRKQKAKHEVSRKALKSACSAKAKKAVQNGEAVDLGDIDLDDDIEPPVERRLTTSDASYESLGVILKANPNGVLLNRDELISLLKPLDRDENAAAKGFFLTGWNGNDSYTFDRITRGTVHLEACCLSLIGGTQPGKLSAYLRSAVRGGDGDDGFAQRLQMLVWPDISKDYREVDRLPSAEPRAAAMAIFDRLAAFDAQDIGAQRDVFDNLPYLRFAPDALEEFQSWRRALELRVRSGELHPALESHFAKYRGLAPRLALILHLIANGTGPVSRTALVQALAWTDYLKTHAERAYAAVAMAEVIGARQIVSKLRSGDIARSFTFRDIHQKGWAGLSDKEVVHASIELLIDHHWISEGVQSATGGRPTITYSANPLGLK